LEGTQQITSAKRSTMKLCGIFIGQIMLARTVKIYFGDVRLF